MTAPTLLTVSGADGTRNLSGNIVMAFDRPIAPGEGEIRLFNEFAVTLFSEDIGAGQRVTISGNTLTIDPPQDLAYGSRYGLYIAPGMLKSAQTGEANTASIAYSFTTGLIPHPVRLEGGSGDEQLIGSDFDDVLSGADGRDELSGHAGDDALDGGPGNDYLDGGSGNDYLDGGPGHDILHSSGGSDTLLGGAGDDILYGDVQAGEAAVLLLSGGAGNDRLYVYGATSLLLGGTGDDRLVFIGGGGTLDGGDGHDRIYIGKTDAATGVYGGAGSDEFILAASLHIPPVLMDFTAGPGGDVLDPYGGLYYSTTQLGAVPGIPPAQFLFTTGHLSLQQDGTDALLQIDRDGAAGHDTDLQTVAILRNVQAAALTLDNFTQGVLPKDVHLGINLTGGAGHDDLAGGMLDDALAGGAGNDRLSSLAGNDFLDGGSGDDILAGMAGNDALYGGAGSDTLEGGAGDDLLDGDDGALPPNGPGVDSAVYGAAFADVRLTHNLLTDPDTLHVSESWQVQDATGALGTDMLTHVERLVLNDKLWALDVGVDGNAGNVYRLYQAAFGRQPDIAGLSYWLHKVDDGLDIRLVADSFTRSDEFHQLLGAERSNADVITLLYHNVLHSGPERDSYAYWVDILDQKLDTAGGLLHQFSARSENLFQVAPIIANGFEYFG